MCAQCACLRVFGNDEAVDEPIMPAGQDSSSHQDAELEVIEMYRRGDMFLRLSLYMQHRELRGVFAILEQKEL